MVRLKVKKTCRLLVVIIGALVYAFWRQGGDWVDYQTELSAEKWIMEMELVRMLAEREIHRRGQSNPQTKGRPWYMAGGTVTPSQTVGEESGLWPEQDPGDDRITNQLMFRPPRLPDVMKPKLKTILLSNGLRTWTGVIRGGDVFSKCPVKSCKLTLDKSESRTADAILFKDKFVYPGHSQINRQVWIMYLLECPYFSRPLSSTRGTFVNWTATYRRDSELVTPYAKFVYYDPNVRQLERPLRNYALNKTKQVAWFVSNCATPNSRLQYALELQKYISVDIFGKCGVMRCPRFFQDMCNELLDEDYKFYLAFENANCKDYITEKFFTNGLMRDILPIVMGARPEDYLLAAPEHSYIHVDDFDSPRALAEFLLLLDKDDERYNSYFRWKGTGEFIDTHFFCRLCAVLHDDFPEKSYRKPGMWWRGPGICTPGSWRESGPNWAEALPSPKSSTGFGPHFHYKDFL